jgi:acetyl-CoA carboxylase biotin carboxylase subunit
MDMAAAEAGAAFGDARVYLERYVQRGRHVEVQVLGDGAGAVMHLGERDCSVQRRYQKLIEESPAPGLDALRARLQEAAVRFAARLQYRGAGTVEFLVDTQREEFYFLEMNARIQVEHPVTEMVTGVDLVAAQIAVAEGRGIGAVAQLGRARDGWAVECRINAEDPARDFMPSPGTVSLAQWPAGAGVRVDTHIASGSRISPFYDSLLGKIIVHGPDRAAALAGMRAALLATRIEGVRTNLAFQQALLQDAQFQGGGVDTGFLARFIEAQAGAPWRRVDG